MKRINSHKYNVLLLKDDVGKPKPNTRRLPDEKFSFGMAIYRDAEDTGQGRSVDLISNKANHLFFSYSNLKMALFSGKSAPKPRQRLQKIKQDSIESACYDSSCKSICPKNSSHLTFILLYSVNINSASSPI